DSYLPHPFVPGGRLYRTFDLGRYTEQGGVEHLGRCDEQVKVRGNRIELGEIEAVLRQHAGVLEWAVGVRANEFGGRSLVAYVALSGDIPSTGAELRSYLQERLPGYMLPAAYVELSHLPVTTSGKLDRKALPAPKAGEPVTGTEGPSNAVEEIVAGIFAEGFWV